MKTIRTDYNGKKDQNKSQKIVIRRDSMIKNIKGCGILEKLQKANVYVTHFSGAKVRYMKDYLQPSLRENSDYFVLHVCTNNIDSNRPPALIAKPMIHVASSLKTNKHDVTISNIITQNDHFMTKANELNKCLSKLCFERNVLLTDYSKTLKSQHFNASKLHLNRRGTSILQNTFSKVLASIFSGQKDKTSVASTPFLNEEYIPEAKSHVCKIGINA